MRVTALLEFGTVMAMLAGVQAATTPPLTEDYLAAVCGSVDGADAEFCAGKALQGQCFGSSLRADTLRRRCACACSEAHQHRIQSCCRAVGEHDMKFCLPLCRYNTTHQELSSTLGVKCVSQLTTWAYCAADATDNSECCRAKGLPSECLAFCKGDVPTCDIQSIFNYQNCLQNMHTIIGCQTQGLRSKPRFDPDWSTQCDWEGR